MRCYKKLGKKDKNYKFNPKHIMCDEAGANIKGIKEALGLEFAKTQIVHLSMAPL